MKLTEKVRDLILLSIIFILLIICMFRVDYIMISFQDNMILSIFSLMFLGIFSMDLFEFVTWRIVYLVIVCSVIILLQTKNIKAIEWIMSTLGVLSFISFILILILNLTSKTEEKHETRNTV